MLLIEIRHAVIILDAWRAFYQAVAWCGRMISYHSALGALDASCQPTCPVQISVEDGLDRITAASIRSPAAIPSSPIALQDGWAVMAEETLGASPYAPVFAGAPLHRVAYGDVLPDFADAVLPLPNVVADSNAFEILSPVAPSENVRATASDLAEGETIVAAGKKLKMLHLTVLKLAGIETVTVRQPRVRILTQGDPGRWLAAMSEREGAQSRIEHLDAAAPDCLAGSGATSCADLVIVTGFQNARDGVVQAVERSGKMLFDGVAVRPGETVCCGIVNPETGPDSAGSATPGSSNPGSSTPGGRNIVSQTRPLPVLFVPDRMECVLMAWLLIVRPCLQRLADAASDDVEERLPLMRKITSMPGFSELALVRRIAGSDNETMFWEPLAIADITLSTIAQADAWLLVEAGSEGYAAGQSVGAKPL